MADLLQFDIPSGARIADAVRTVEDMVPRARPLTFSPVFDGRGRVVVRMCTFTGAWDKYAPKTVIFKYQTATPNTASATNLFADVPSPASTANCAIAREGTAWFLIAAECP